MSCASQDLTPSQVIHQLIRQYRDDHHKEYATKVKKRTPQVNDRVSAEK